MRRLRRSFVLSTSGLFVFILYSGVHSLVFNVEIKMGLLRYLFGVMCGHVKRVLISNRGILRRNSLLLHLGSIERMTGCVRALFLYVFINRDFQFGGVDSPALDIRATHGAIPACTIASFIAILCYDLLLLVISANGKVIIL